jgi:hypothetical protein
VNSSAGDSNTAAKKSNKCESCNKELIEDFLQKAAVPKSEAGNTAPATSLSRNGGNT